MFERIMRIDANGIFSTTPRRVWRTTTAAGCCRRRASTAARCRRCRSPYVKCSASGDRKLREPKQCC